MTWIAPAASWSLELRLDGVDMTASLTDDVEIDAERDAARTLTATLDVTGPVTPDDYTGRSVTLDVLYAGGRYRRFTGEVLEPQVIPFSNALVLECTDARAARRVRRR